jgi:hypothetical protein
MALFLLVYTSWCPADLGRRQSVSHRHESPRCGDSPVLLPSTSTRCDSLAPDTTVLARPPAGAPAGGCVACRVPAPGLPPSSPMPRGPPLRAPPLFPECMDPDGNRMGADSCAPVGPAAASGPGFHICWPPSGPRVSARAIPVSVDGRGPPADARVPGWLACAAGGGGNFD